MALHASGLGAMLLAMGMTIACVTGLLLPRRVAELLGTGEGEPLEPRVLEDVGTCPP